jgi:hypothetical protein
MPLGGTQENENNFNAKTQSLSARGGLTRLWRVAKYAKTEIPDTNRQENLRLAARAFNYREGYFTWMDMIDRIKYK